MTKLVEKDALRTVEEDNIEAPDHYEAKAPQIITADTARQAPRGTPVLWVLIGGLIAIGIAWIVIHSFIY